MESLTIELRPRIQSCNVFICLKEPTETHLVEICPAKNSIKVIIADNPYTIDIPTVNIITNSMSNLNVSEKWIVFRVQTAPINTSTGNFSTEVFNNLDAIENDCADTSEVILHPSRETPTSLLCYSCDNLISLPNLLFQRIMQLPSTDCEPSEWFCCGEFDYQSLLRPRILDFFYDSHFCILNRGIFGSNLKINRKDVVCNSCNIVLGVTHDECSLKIWNHSLKYQLHRTPVVNVESTTPLDDFKLALGKCAGKGAVREVLFVAIEDEKHHYLLVKLIEKKLNLLVESEVGGVDNPSIVRKFVMKVLYQCPMTSSPELRHLTSAHVCQIGLYSLMAGLEYLMETTKRIPPIYSHVNDFRVGYIM